MSITAILSSGINIIETQGPEMSYPLIWLILIAIFLVIEIITLGVTTVWFACGAFVAFIVSLFFDNIIAEFIVFLIVSIAMLVFTKPIVVKKFNLKKEKTNYDRVLGMVGNVMKTISNLDATGKVIVSGQEWTARSVNDTKIEKGSKVLIKEIVGVKLIVEKIEEEV